MKKPVKILCLVLALLLFFVLGWRVMPKVWPSIREGVVYPLIPGLRPAPTEAPARELYAPESNTAFTDEIAATDSVIYYFYKDYCPWCKQLEPLIAGLPQQITLPDGTVSRVRVIALNKVEDEPLQVITDYYTAHGIPEEKQYVPALVIGEEYLFAGEEIIGGLMDALVTGEGLKTPLINGRERVAE